MATNIFASLAELETKCHEYKRAWHIYKYAINYIPRKQINSILDQYISFEKKHGDQLGFEAALVSKQRLEYEQKLHTNPELYDYWFDYIRLEESSGNPERVRNVYERAISNIPPSEIKRFWKR